MSGEPIPEGNTPVFNTAMRGIVVTATGFSANVKVKIFFLNFLLKTQISGKCLKFV